MHLTSIVINRLLVSSCILLSLPVQSQKLMYHSRAFDMYADRIVQGRYEGKALSDRELTSNYQSPANLYRSANISFKFSINGKDNEMLSGNDHHFTVEATDGIAETPLIEFGTQLKQGVQSSLLLKPNTRLKIRLDLRHVLKSFQEKGYYTCFNDAKIYQQDFKGVYVAGSEAPMVWDFDNLVHHRDLELKDDDKDGIYELELVLNKEQDKKQTASTWKLSKDISAFPQYTAPFTLSNAIYNLSLEEMQNAVEPDSTFRTGKEWAGVWTRDISYSIILSMAYLQPDVAKKSLLKKVNSKKRIIQDTGTGGAYPASTDRMIWAVAAWEVYKATGDKEWLELAYVVTKNSIEDDIQNVYDPITGLVKGESSFLDWRDQTYPKWMQPADIYESECLGTNAVHYQANMVLSQMAQLLQHADVATRHEGLAGRIRQGINKYLWMADKGYYAQYLYGRNHKIMSPRSEALGEALCVLFGITASKEQDQQVVASTPVIDFGVPCIYPQIPGIPPYHNNAVWPFVQSYWAQASAKAGNDQAVVESFANIYRQAALFLTNKENYVGENGDFAGTQINSSNMLWSLSGNIALVHKIIFGMHFEADKLVFNPFVPKVLAGKHLLTGFTYRQAKLSIEVEGYGDKISSFILDGKKRSDNEIPSSLTGAHVVKIRLTASQKTKNDIHKVANLFSPAAPVVTYNNGHLSWNVTDSAVSYAIIRNGEVAGTITATSYVIPAQAQYAAYQVCALDKHGISSFASEPIEVTAADNVLLIPAEQFASPASHNYPGFNGGGFVEVSRQQNRIINFELETSEPGMYAVDFRYANGNGPTNTDNKCAIRSLKVDDKKAGTIVFPQRGTNEWSNWGYTNAVQVKLSAGKHLIALSFEDYNDNMNIAVNQAMIDEMRLTKISTR